ncbi:hypothetical protein [Streptomyces sp. NPDC059446]|uniref:hypothetical protein n=1 Tax=Streptomyces sp. NPDC059446 TaxID=3346833 RepID=UPI0036B485F0
MHISEMFRLVRGTGHILDVLDVFHRDRLALRMHDGACSATDLAVVELAALDDGVTVRRGQGYTVRITTVPAVHRQLLDRCRPLDDTAAVPAQRKARREYENRVSALAPTGP